MLLTQDIIDTKFLSVCPPSEAVAWLKDKRQSTEGTHFRENRHAELTLAARNDPYIDFGLARCGSSTDAGKLVYGRGDLGIRCTYLAHFPGGGFSLFDRFELSDQPPGAVEELSALISNPTLSDTTFVHCFKKDDLFQSLSDEQFQMVIHAASENPRLWQPYDRTYLDGFAEYSHESVFTAAWKLTEKVPNTPHWATTLYHLLRRCLPPVGFDANQVLARWTFPLPETDPSTDAGYYLRSKLADLLKADEALLRASDGAIRSSFYRRFEPSKYQHWPNFAQADPDVFLDAALNNPNLWRSGELREQLERLCWDHPDPDHHMDIPNSYRAIEKGMRRRHPEWFPDEA